jgi:nuclear pore complex protein Nup133
MNYSSDKLARGSIKGRLGDVSNLNLSRRANRDGLYLQQFGGTVPVVVTEALRFRRNVAGGFGPGQLVYIIGQRQMIIWDWNEDINRGKIPNCYTLQLPSSEHGFTTNCVLLQSVENSAVSCIVVSREGFVRYWNNIAHETSFAETTIDNRRHECMAVVPFQVRSDTCCVISQTGDLILLTIKKLGLDWRIVKFSSGLLSGISRRFSSYLFSSQGQSSLGNLRCACTGEFADEAEYVYVIVGSMLQKCLFSNFEESLVYQCPVESLFTERLADDVWKLNTYQPSGIKVALLDIKYTSNGLFVLGCGVNVEVNATVHYAIGILPTEGRNPPQSFLSFIVVPTKTVYSEIDKFGDASVCRLLLDDKSNAFVYFKHSVICMSLTNPADNSFSIEFSPTDQMIGFGFARNFPAVFSSSHGLQRLVDGGVAQSSFVDQSYQDTSLISNTSSMQTRNYDVSTALASVTQDRLLEMTMSEDEFSQFKAAFLCSTRNELANAFSLTDELFPGHARPRAESSLLDVLSARLSKNILDDVPSKDPRWAKMSSGTGFSTASLILMHQLDDKARVHAIYVNFFKTMKLVDKLGVVALRGAFVPTGVFLGEQAEKLAAARMLVELQVQHARVVDTVVSRLVRARNSAAAVAGGLTEQDVFYREVSRFDDVIVALIDVESELRSHSLAISEQVGIVQSVNAVIMGIVGAVNQYRLENEAEMLPLSHLTGPNVEYIPWFCPIEEQTGRFVLLKQHALTATCLTSEATNSSEIDVLFQQLVVLTDIILEAYNTWFEWKVKQQSDGSLSEKAALLKHEFETRKQQLLEPFMRGKRYEQAMSLAEKYCEFGTLVEVCRITEDEDRLQK